MMAVWNFGVIFGLLVRQAVSRYNAVSSSPDLGFFTSLSGVYIEGRA